ncbi:MAG: DnaJ domain-containing protein [Cyanobacteria bacterium]|jgi:curved DNA-binding protein|nr:DnaJ domain-containing protein [Cyanobacteria bacterium GSL.Bin21]
MQNLPNYYELLDVSPDATVEEIKRAYRRLARKYHPDLNPGDKQAEETFKDLVEAYDVLCDPEERQKYDQLINSRNPKSRRRSQASNPKTRRSPASTENGRYGSDFNRFVEQTFRQKTQRQTGKTPSQSSRRVPRDEGSTYRPGTRKTAYKAPTDPTRSETERPRDVEARLKLPLDKAYRGGKERIRLEDGRSLEIDMPSGMIDGQQMRLRGQGIGGGDLYLTITIAPHCLFKLKDKDVFCRIPVSPSEAVLGSAIQVPTLDGLVEMSIPAGIKSGQRLRLANKGYPVDGERGDQLVEIQIVVPPEPTAEEKELYQKLQEIQSFAPRDSLLKSRGE